jgi:hypothetical protein
MREELIELMSAVVELEENWSCLPRLTLLVIV